MAEQDRSLVCHRQQYSGDRTRKKEGFLTALMQTVKKMQEIVKNPLSAYLSLQSISHVHQPKLSRVATFGEQMS